MLHDLHGCWGLFYLFCLSEIHISRDYERRSPLTRTGKELLDLLQRSGRDRAIKRLGFRLADWRERPPALTHNDNQYYRGIVTLLSGCYV